jgi:hypothetical protein
MTWSGTALEQAAAAAEPGSERRRQLEAAKVAMRERRELLTQLAHGAQDTLAKVPPENIALLQRHHAELAEAMMAAADLDAIDLFAAAEAAGVPIGAM